MLREYVEGAMASAENKADFAALLERMDEIEQLCDHCGREQPENDPRGCQCDNDE